MQAKNECPINIAQLVVVISICFGWFILTSVRYMLAGFPVAPFQDNSLWGICLFELLMTAAALTVLHFSRFDIRSLLPAPSLRGAFYGTAIALLALAITWPLTFAFGLDDPAVAQVEDLIEQSRVTLPAALALSAVNGAYEEIFLCGYLLRSVAGLGASMAIGVSALVRILYHVYQGPFGTIAVLAFGLLVSTYYWRTRQLWPVVFAHALLDLLALVG